MIEVNGLYSSAKIFTDEIDETSLEQIQLLVDDPISDGQVVRMMPDVHAGNGCVIGTTMTITDKVAPSLVGVDIGCSVAMVKLEVEDIDLTRLDETIKKVVPSGFNRRETPHEFIKNTDIENLRCVENVDINGGGQLSLGTLGGGNHFIEVNKGQDGLYLVIHSGSRNLGLQVCNYYNKQARLEFQKENPRVKRPFYVCEDQLFEDYLHDMRIMQDFAVWNRNAMFHQINEEYSLGIDIDKVNHTIHNYIDLDNMILRKGAISAQENEIVLIPINMRDGSIIAKGKGNSDWNYSAPHGAGRLYSRREARDKFSLEEFKESMKDVYTTCVREDTLDESPFAYKSIDSILSNLDDTVDVIDIIKPVYNFKA